MIRTYQSFITAALVGLVSLLPSTVAFAQGNDNVGEEQGRGVARLSLMAGDVSVRRGDTGEWVAATVNAPVMSEDRILTSDGARAEVQFDYGNFARLSRNTELRLADIEKRRYLVRLAQGMVTWRVLRDYETEVEISTPSIAVRPTKRGTYRVAVLADGSTEVTVRSGEAEIYTPQGSQRLKSGRTLMARGTFNDPEFQTVGAIDKDDWDLWNERRDRDLESSVSYRYVNNSIYGAEDLDRHGRWINTPEYGNVWVPDTSAGWVPYRNGRWNWVDYYGWNWISYDPWGWAPYHYGRWFHRANVGWCWWPGQYRTRSYWSPALVGFFGFGRGGISVGVGVGFGNWGWVPLAPFENYNRWYGRGYYGGFRNRTYVDNSVTIINNTNITNVYRNARGNNGVTVINGNDFGRGRVNAINVDQRSIERASMVRGQLPVTPDRASLRMSDNESRVSARADGGGRGEDRFFSRTQPTRIERASFENQRAVVEEGSRRTFGGDRGAASDRVAGDRSDRGASRGSMDAGGSRGSVDTGASRGSMDSGAARSADRTAGADRTAAGNDRATRGDVSRGSMESRTGETRTDNSERGGWRRFGGDTTRTDAGTRSSEARSSESRGSESRGSMDRGTDTRGSDTRGTMDRSSDSRNSDARTGADRSESRSSESRSGGWRRFGDAGSSADRSTSVDRGNVDRGSMDRGSSDRGSTDRGSIDRGSSRTDAGRTDGSILRDRSSERTTDRSSERSSDRGGFGGFGRTDRTESSTPRVERNSGGDRGGFGGFGGSRGESSAPRMERNSGGSIFGGGSSRGESSAPRMERNSGGDRGGFGGGRSESSAPRMERNSGGGGGSAPRMERGGGGERGGGRRNQ